MGLLGCRRKRHSLLLHKLRAEEHKALQLLQLGPSLGTCILMFHRWSNKEAVEQLSCNMLTLPKPCTTWLAEFVSPWGGRASSSPRLNIWNRTLFQEGHASNFPWCCVGARKRNGKNSKRQSGMGLVYVLQPYIKECPLDLYCTFLYHKAIKRFYKGV